MRVSLGFWSFSLAPVITAMFVLVPLFSAPGQCQNTDAGCVSIKERWEKTFQELRDKIQDFSTIQQTPVARLIQKPLYDTASGRTIASQVGEALQAKEEVLNAKRRECKDMMTLEDELFSRLQECGGNG